MTKSLKRNYPNLELSQTEIEFFKKELKEKKEKIEQSLHNATQESCTQTANRCSDEGDHAIFEVTNNVNAALAREQTITLKKINRSLNKIAIGTYGICTGCKEPINVNRLKIQMFTEYCVPCKQLMERTK